MAVPFNPHGGLIIIPVTLGGPQREVIVELALDTGATTSVINQSALEYAGLELDEVGEPAEITTGSGIESVLEVRLGSIHALGKIEADFPILCHNLPPSATVDGVLGLDFLRGECLVIDFLAGLLALE